MSSVIDLSDVVLDLASGSYTVTRTTPGGYGTDGRFVPGTPSTLTIQASVQPARGQDLLLLPEGMRTEETLKVYSPTRLFTQGAGQDPDVITVAGITYKVMTAEQWGPDGAYWKILASKIGRAAP